MISCCRGLASVRTPTIVGGVFVLLGVVFAACDAARLIPRDSAGGGEPVGLPLAAVAAVWAGAGLLLYACLGDATAGDPTHTATPAAREGSAPT